MTDKMTAFLAMTKENGWFCPQPQKWNRLWGMLPERTQLGVSWNPPLPLILAAWWDASDEQKRERFIAHLQWADSHGVTNEIIVFLESLSPEDWFNGHN
jgi:hypothetical protein